MKGNGLNKKIKNKQVNRNESIYKLLWREDILKCPTPQICFPDSTTIFLQQRPSLVHRKMPRQKYRYQYFNSLLSLFITFFQGSQNNLLLIISLVYHHQLTSQYLLSFYPTIFFSFIPQYFNLIVFNQHQYFSFFENSPKVAKLQPSLTLYNEIFKYYMGHSSFLNLLYFTFIQFLICHIQMKIVAFLGLVALGTNALRVAEQQHDGQYAWYTFNEGPTGNRCRDANQCDGQRKCSAYGWCSGTSRPPKNADYKYDEAVTGNKCPTSSSDPNWANRNYYCDGNRTCSSFGWCEGKSR